MASTRIPFVSSSPGRQISSDSADEVERLVDDALYIDQLSPSLESTITENQAIFFDCFHRKVELIKSRSQAFSDNHVTVYDKTLLRLTQNGEILNTPAAIAFFCEEFLGISPQSPRDLGKSTLQETITTSSIIAQVLTPRETPAVDEQEAYPSKLSSELSSIISHADPSLERLWSVYQQAKDEYFEIEDSTSEKKQRAARFLRDTAENTIDHLQGRVIDQRLLDDLVAHLEIAKQCAMSFFGGKKRKFDDEMPGARVDHLDDMTVRRQPVNHSGTAYQGRRQRPVQDRRSSGHPPSEYSSQGSRYQGRGNGRVSGRKQPGRGHSGIPFGYSRRTVDSYQPGR